VVWTAWDICDGIEQVNILCHLFVCNKQHGLSRNSISQPRHHDWILTELVPMIIMCIFVCFSSTANSLLRLALDGRISMFFVPPQFTKQKGTIIIIKVGVFNIFTQNTGRLILKLAK